jgi:hypothetical protein
MTELVDSTGDTVKIVGDLGEIHVEWGCGGTRRFLPGDLTATMEFVELVSESGGGSPVEAWLSDVDSHGVGFSVRIAGGRLYAADGPHDEESPYIGWAAFKTALQEAKGSRAVRRPKSGGFRRLVNRLRNRFRKPTTKGNGVRT